MDKFSSHHDFDKLVKNKFHLYNSMFLNLPYPNVSNIGILIPLLYKVCKQGLESKQDPVDILDAFFSKHTSIQTEEEKIDFMFRVVQYVERQVVLYDSVEDAAFTQLLSIENQLTLRDYILLSTGRGRREELLGKLNSFSTRVVFTAHPTQFYPLSVLTIINRLRTQININEINEIDLSLQQLGLTSLMNKSKPTPYDEAMNIIFYLRNVYYDAVHDLYAGIKKSVGEDGFDNPSILQLGFWPGGDRDGNPFVTAETTRKVADALRMSLMKCYYDDVKKLAMKLTFSDVEDILQDLISSLYFVRFEAEKTLKYEDIYTPLLKIREILAQNYNNLYSGDVENLIEKVRIFKTHFAALDIRQNHSVHHQTVEAILKKLNRISTSLDELKKEELISILIHEKIHISAEQFEDERIRDTLSNILQLKDIQAANGEEGCNRYIISNSEDIYSVLFVYALLRGAGWGETAIPMDIIPLFESMEGMKNAEAVMRELFEIPEYRDHLRGRKDTQTVMLGFSDGTKDGGYLKANWSIFKTKENLSALCAEYGIKVIFFDGRGGPPARGGGKTQRFYASHTDNIANHAIQLTIQGQTISSRFGTKEHFNYNCDQLLMAGISHSLSEKENSISGEFRWLIEELAERSFEKYASLKNHDKFIPYLERKSTLMYYGQTNIGSRPVKRGSKERLELKDLRAIPFVGSWSQLKQNVPGYFGVGTALQSLVKEGKLQDLQRLFREVPFFNALISNSMMSLSKCNFELTRYISKDEEFREFWNILLAEYELSREMTLLISGYEVLMQEEPVTRSSVTIREDIVLPLLVIQQYALQKIDQASGSVEAYRKIVKRSLYGNINASRNSA